MGKERVRVWEREERVISLILYTIYKFNFSKVNREVKYIVDMLESIPWDSIKRRDVKWI